MQQQTKSLQVLVPALLEKTRGSSPYPPSLSSARDAGALQRSRAKDARDGGGITAGLHLQARSEALRRRLLGGETETSCLAGSPSGVSHKPRIHLTNTNK